MTYRVEENISQDHLAQQLNALSSAGWEIFAVCPIMPALHGAVFTIIARKEKK